MKENGKRLVIASAALLFSIPLATSAKSVRQNTAPDNTRTNKQDRQQSSPTADQQKANSSDTEIAKQIRSSVVKDKSLSTYAHNVKIIVQNGKVALKGPVRSEEEKSNIAAKAAAVAGESNVTNQLTVAPPKQ
jgi:osmotically-inducible protein OsmY